jgi:ADP-heptose:LPS heptosyltransferase
MINLKNKRVIISKTNQIGDVTFSLPLASELKRLEPACKIIFLSREYTRSLIEHYQDVDEFSDWESLNKNDLAEGLRALHADIIIHVTPNKPIIKAAKKAKIPLRIGTASKILSWFTCNRLVYNPRSKSPLHETQLDMMFLKPLGGKKFYSLNDIIALRRYKPFNHTAPCLNLLDPHKFNLILHPKTRGEHIEWLPEQFATLIKMLPPEKFKIFITGNQKEGDQVRHEMIEPFPQIVDLFGKISLDDFMQLIAKADGMICASTGPVHLAANFGIYTLGLYAPIKPFDAGRWGPVGAKAEVLAIQKNCEACRYHGKCKCITEITPQQVYDAVCRWYDAKNKAVK